MNQVNSVIPWWRVQFSDVDASGVSQAIQNEHISLGPITAAFETKLAESLGIPYVVATTSGSMALLMSMMVLGIGPGDEVIIPNRTWIAAAHAVKMVGAKVVFVDVRSDAPIIDVSLLEAKITPKTKAIIPTALSGRAVQIGAINKLAKKYGIYVIEDAAQSMFSYEAGRYSGTQSDIGCFSLSVAKLIPTGQGGFLATHDENLYKELKKIRTHGVADLLTCTFTRFGFNFRYTDLQASLGLSQLASVEDKLDKLNKIYALYENELRYCQQIRLIPVDIANGEVPLYIEVLCQNRDDLADFLNMRQIQTKNFYPNLNRATYFECHDEFPQANIFESQGITLPCGPDQSLDNILRVTEAILAFENNSIRVLKEAAN